ncbi:MAG: hypothetical protein KatS3mg008_1645 [Acidimicrobiales bacterium]|nr:MAG: hypothetical protein KatS3mg008_1645 [Acidimicrobiales bacterium]
MDPRTPVIVAVGQSIERAESVDGVELMERAARAALAEAGPLASRVGEVVTVRMINQRLRAPASRLAERLGLTGVARATTTVGGNTPQWLVTRTAERIWRGEVDCVLIAGAEPGRSARHGSFPPDEADERDPVLGDDRPGTGPAENAIGLVLPIHIYPMFESVLASRAGRDPEQQRRFLGEIMAPFTEVAASHPYAWFPVERSAEEIASVTPDNRLVAEPYTKSMCAIMAVDQGAALVITTAEAAAAAGLAERAVFVWAGASADDVWFPSARPDPGSSPAIRAAAESLWQAAGVTVDDVAHLDVYSCFPSAVQIGAEALGLSVTDPRGLTVTGGLPYFGGPGNDYTMHAIATTVERIRETGGLGLCTGLGWYVTKHALGLYGAEPPPNGFRVGDTSAAQERIDAGALEVVESHEGLARVVAGTVAYDKQGNPVSAPVFAETPDGRRVVAAAAESELPHLVGRFLVGATVRVSGSPPTYRVETEASQAEVEVPARDPMAESYR